GQLCGPDSHGKWCRMLIGYVSDEYYAALEGAALEFASAGQQWLTHSWPSGAVHAELPPGSYSVIVGKPGFGSKRSTVTIGAKPVHFRLLSDRLLGYAWPKWCRAGEAVQFRVHAVEQY